MARMIQTDAAPDRRVRMLAAVAEAGGVMRRVELVHSGHSQRTVATAIDEGAVLGIRRTWIALPGADPFLVAAARSGVVLSCVTQARRLGLWVDAPVAESHVCAPPHAGRVTVAEGTRVHRSAPVVPRPPGRLEDGIENTLAVVCACQSFETALAVAESAFNKRLATRASMLRLPLRARAREVIETATPFSDSGLETLVVPRLRWMKLRIVPQAWIAGRRVDFLIGRRLVLQIDGGHHVGRQRASDNRHDAALMQLGYHVIRVGYIEMIEDWPGVQALIMNAIAQGLHLA
jgi:very-short-patch-repair endonuclease